MQVEVHVSCMDRAQLAFTTTQACNLQLRGGWHVTNLQLEEHPGTFRKCCTQACHMQLRASLQLATAGNLECTRVIVDVACKLHGSDRSDPHPQPQKTVGYRA